MIVFSERDDHPQSKWTSLLQKMSDPVKEENFEASVSNQLKQFGCCSSEL